jgi:hypothetical protein
VIRMTKHAESNSWTLSNPGVSGRYESSNVDGNKYIDISGIGFGLASTIEIWREWTNGNTGQDVSLTAGAGEIGDFTSGSYATGLPPKFFSKGNTQGASIREGGTDASVDNRRTGAIKVSDPFTEVLIMSSDAVPDGHYFTGTSAVNTLPITSNYKGIWLSDGPLDDPALADIVFFSYIGTGAGWVIVGNQASDPIYMGDSSYNFNGWNYKACYQKAGTDPFLDNGITRAFMANPEGATSIVEVLDQPMFANATNAQYTHVNAPGWVGENNQDNVLHIFRHYYLAVGANAGNVVVVGDDPVLSNCTQIRPLPHEIRTDTRFKSLAVSTKLREGMTHYFVMRLDLFGWDSPVASGELEWL